MNNKDKKGVNKNELAATYIPTTVSCSIIGDEGLSFLVRNGARRFPLSIATRIVERRLLIEVLYQRFRLLEKV